MTDYIICKKCKKIILSDLARVGICFDCLEKDIKKELEGEE